MRNLCLTIFFLIGCNAKKEATHDTLLPVLISQLKTSNDSLQTVKKQVLKFANLYINDMNNKSFEDSMEYWSGVQKKLLYEIAVTKYSIDSVQRLLH